MLSRWNDVGNLCTVRGELNQDSEIDRVPDPAVAHIQSFLDLGYKYSLRLKIDNPLRLLTKRL